jgi:hypothetical protein
MTERQELYCHNCGNYVQFDIDMELDGNHVLKCPVCGHEHCRVVKNGKITEDRWDSRNQSYIINSSTLSYSTNSTYTMYSSTNSTSASSYLYMSWMNTTSYN